MNANTPDLQTLDLEIRYAKHKAAQAIKRLEQDIHVWGAADQDLKRRARTAVAHVNALNAMRLAATLDASTGSGTR